MCKTSCWFTFNNIDGSILKVNINDVSAGLELNNNYEERKPMLSTLRVQKGKPFRSFEAKFAAQGKCECILWLMNRTALGGGILRAMSSAQTSC